jgi:uncharacterized membrane protein YkoI
MTRTRVLAAVVAGLTLAGLGTAATALGSDDPAAAAPVTVVAQTRTSTPTATSTTATPTAAADALNADEAGSRAVVRVGGGTVTDVERETEHGRTMWKVDVRRDTRLTEVYVDVATGAVTRIDDDSRTARVRDDRSGDDRSGDDRGRRGGDDRGRDDRGRDDHGRHGSDDGPGHDRFDDKGGDR